MAPPIRSRGAVSVWERENSPLSSLGWHARALAADTVSLSWSAGDQGIHAMRGLGVIPRPLQPIKLVPFGAFFVVLFSSLQRAL